MRIDAAAPAVQRPEVRTQTSNIQDQIKSLEKQKKNLQERLQALQKSQGMDENTKAALANDLQKQISDIDKQIAKLQKQSAEAARNQPSGLTGKERSARREDEFVRSDTLEKSSTDIYRLILEENGKYTIQKDSVPPSQKLEAMMKEREEQNQTTQSGLPSLDPSERLDEEALPFERKSAEDDKFSPLHV